MDPVGPHGRVWGLWGAQGPVGGSTERALRAASAAQPYPLPWAPAQGVKPPPSPTKPAGNPPGFGAALCRDGLCAKVEGRYRLPPCAVPRAGAARAAVGPHWHQPHGSGAAPRQRHPPTVGSGSPPPESSSQHPKLGQLWTWPRFSPGSCPVPRIQTFTAFLNRSVPLSLPPPSSLFSIICYNLRIPGSNARNLPGPGRDAEQAGCPSLPPLPPPPAHPSPAVTRATPGGLTHRRQTLARGGQSGDNPGAPRSLPSGTGRRGGRMGGGSHAPSPPRGLSPGVSTLDRTLLPGAGKQSSGGAGRGTPLSLPTAQPRAAVPRRPPAPLLRRSVPAAPGRCRWRRRCRRGPAAPGPGE